MTKAVEKSADGGGCLSRDGMPARRQRNGADEAHCLEITELAPHPGLPFVMCLWQICAQSLADTVNCIMCISFRPCEGGGAMRFRRAAGVRTGPA